MSAKKNQLLTKSEALKESWKNRKDYVGYDRTKGSSFNSWRAIIYTEKGKRIGFPPEWNDYKIFLNDVAGEWARGKIVVRNDNKLPHSSNNSYWSEKGYESISKLIKLTYNDVTKTICEWCEEFNLNYNGVRQRYFKGKNFTPKEILFGRQKKHRTPRERDLAFRTARMFGAYRLKDKNKGRLNNITLEYMRNEIKKGCIYCGDTDSIGLDRIDNNLGHQIGNVVPCCYDCNTSRNNNFTHEEMLVLGKTIKEIKDKRKLESALSRGETITLEVC